MTCSTSTPCASKNAFAGRTPVHRLSSPPHIARQSRYACTLFCAKSSDSENGFHTSTSFASTVVMNSGPRHHSASVRLDARCASGILAGVSPHTHEPATSALTAGSRQCSASTTWMRFIAPDSMPRTHAHIASKANAIAPYFSVRTSPVTPSSTSCSPDSMLCSRAGSAMSRMSCLNLSVRHMPTAKSSTLSNLALPMRNLTMSACVDACAICVPMPSITRNASLSWHCMTLADTSGTYTAPSPIWLRNSTTAVATITRSVL